MAAERETTVERDTARLDALRAVDRALGREAHVLASRPELTWQQLYNRLQWEEPPLAERLTAERERRSRPGARPWIHRYTRLSESEALVRTLSGHTDWVLACAVSPDGTRIVSASSDGTLKVWETASGAERATLTGHTDDVWGCAVSPDGRWIVSASWDQTLKIWDATTGAERRTLTGHTDAVAGCAVSPDGTWIVSASRDHTLKVWDAASGSTRLTLRGHTDFVRGCAVSPDGTWIVSASNDGTLKVWDAETGKMVRTLAGHTSEVTACAVSPDGTWIVSASDDETLKVWNAASGAQRATLTGHGAEQVAGCAVSPDGTWIVSASNDGTLKVWDAETGKMVRTLAGHSNWVRGCAVSPDGTWIVSASVDETLKVWDATSGYRGATRTGHTNAVNGCAVSPDGTWIISASADETLKMWDAASGVQRRTLTGHLSVVWGCAVSPDGTWIVSASNDSTLRVWDAASGTERATLTGHTNGVAACAVSPDGTWIVSASPDGTLKVWDLASGIERLTLTGHSAEVNGCAVSPDGTWIVSAGGDTAASDRATTATLRVWDAASGIVRRTLAGHTDFVWGCAVSPDGAWLVSASKDGTLRIWDAATGAVRNTLTGHTDWVRGCAVSPDGAWIVSASDDGTFRVWDAASGAERAVLVVPGAATAVALHPCAPILTGGDAGGSVHLAHLVGIDLGPLVVTATDDRGTNTVRCPACRQPFALDPDRLGTQATCPRPGCNTELRVNPFVVHGGSARVPGWDAVRRGPMVTSALTSGVLSPRPVDVALDTKYLNRPLERPSVSPRLPRSEPVRAVPNVRSVDRAAPAPAVRASPSLGELVALGGLHSVDLGGGDLAIPFDGTRAGQLVVRARTLAGGLAFFAVSLPKPGMFGGEAALRSLLRVSCRANYVKALVLPNGELALACEQDLPVLSPERVRGLVRGLTALGDVRKGDLGDGPGWERRLLACRRAQAADIALDPDQATAALRDLAAAAGLAVREVAPSALIVALDVDDTLQFGARVSEHLVSLTMYLGGVKPRGDRTAYLRRLLELNRSVSVARLGLDGDGGVALLYEVPEVGPDLLDRVREQFGLLLAGVLALARGP